MAHKWCSVAGRSDAPLSSGEGWGGCSAAFVGPHAASDPVGEVALVGASGLPRGLAFGGLAGDVDADGLMVALLVGASDSPPLGPTCERSAEVVIGDHRNRVFVLLS